MMAKLLIVAGVLLLVAGLLLLLFPGALGWFGRLPGDIRIEGERGGFYFPIVSMLIVSVVLSLLWRWFGS
jgi:hypothetical protein